MKLDKFVEKTNYIIMLGIFLMLPITFVIKFYGQYISLFREYGLFFHDILWLIIPVEIFVYVYNLVKKKFKITIYDYLLYVLIILALISTNMAIDMRTSIWGAYLRNEGLLSILSYYLLFLNCKTIITKEQIKKIIKVFIIVGIINSVFAYMQVFVRGPYLIESVDGIQYMALGMNGNPNFLGSYMVMLLSLTIAMYLLEEKSKYYLFVSILFMSTLILAASTGPFFSLIFIVIFLIIMLAIKKKLIWKKVWILASTLILTCFITDFVSEKTFVNIYHDEMKSGYTIKSDLINTLSLIFNIENDDGTSREELIENYGSGRFGIWKDSLKIIERYPLLGTGLDNFGYAYSDIIKPQGYYCDKAHNIYIQICATNGIPALLVYLTLLGFVFFKSIKTKDELTIILVISFIAYSVQGFLNISTTTVAPFYFIIMGLLVGQLNIKENYK